MHSLLEQQRQWVTAMRQQGGKKQPTVFDGGGSEYIYLISLATRSWHGFKWGYSLLGEPMPRPRYHIDLQLQRKRHTMDVSPGSERYFKMHKVKFGGLPDPLHLFRLSYFRPGIYMATLTLHVSFNSAKDYSPNLRNGFRNSKMNLPFTSGLTRHLWILSSFFAFFFL